MKKFLIKLLCVLCAVCCLFLSACDNDEPDGSDDNGSTEGETQSTGENGENIDNTSDKIEGEQNIMYIKIGDTTLTATLVDNSSTKALKNMLPLTIEMNDYGNFEKVGSLGTTLPRNDEQISTDAGDLILYQGNSFVIYYDKNSWNFTRLGKINNVSKSELKKILGSGSVTVTLFL